MALRFSPTRGAASLVLSAAIRGQQGPAATIEIGSVQTLDPGADPTVVNSGTIGAAVLNFQIPTSKTISVSSTVTGQAGTAASVSDVGTVDETRLAFSIPRGSDAGHKFTFDTSTSMSAPSSGGVRFNNATPGSITQIAINATDADGNTVRPYMLTWDDSTNTAKGAVVFKREGTGTSIVFLINGTITDNTTWLQIPVTWSAGATLFSASDPVYVRPDITGNKGTDGSIAGSTGVDDNRLLRSDGTGGATLKNSSVTVDDSGNMSGVATVTTTGPIELGDAADTTLSRASAGVVAVEGVNLLKANGNQNLTGGFTATSYSAGSKTTGTFTPDPTLGNIQHYTNGGAHTLAPPSSACTMVLECTNASAGAITTSGFTIVDGDTYSSTGTKKHIFYITKTNSYSHLNVRYVTGT